MKSKKTFCYEYPRPMVTVDAVVLRMSNRGTEFLAVRRKNEPFAGRWALPGGFVDMEETLEDAVSREVEEETALTGISFVQLGAFDQPGRDPRGRNIAIAFLGVCEDQEAVVRGGDDAEVAQWIFVEASPGLAFDHEEILAMAINRVKAPLR